jgi:hypothetical protein
MEITTKHIGSLLGRVFLVSSKKAIKEWGGYDEENNGQSDYDSITDNISFEEAGVDSFLKEFELKYLTFFTMSSKVEIFKVQQGVIVCEGLYFNESWDYSKQLVVKVIEETSHEIAIDDQSIIIVDAAVNGRDLELKQHGIINVLNNSHNSFCVIDLENAVYRVKKIQVKIEVDKECIERMGIELCKR